MKSLAEQLADESMIDKEMVPFFQRLFDFVFEGKALPEEEKNKWIETEFLQQEKGKWYLTVSNKKDPQLLAIDIILAGLCFQGKVERVKMTN